MVEKEKPEENVIIEEALEVVEAPKAKNKEKELTQTLQRLQAEFQNFQKRAEKEKQEIIINANKNLISQFLEVLDNLELSLKHNKDEGVEIIYKDLKKILEKQGLKPISTQGKFNPEFHEALVQEDEKENGIILEEFQKGYLLNGKLLRASKVKISKKSSK